mmetsp:Transcript_27740/g.34298  ORF Transcript_27740/g.34298 Transcript_27740/m.34298 type:complete len:89 (+) Transcript_27740:104-370(+)
MRGKIRITLEQLRIAAKKPKRGTPVCHNETMKILNALEASNYEVAPLYKYVQEADKCFELAKMEKKKRKASTLYHLTKYLVQDKNKKK